MSPNRLVAVFTPLVFAPLAGTIAAFLAHNVPGVKVSEGELTQVFIAGALIAFAKAAQWTRGWQKYEERHDVAGAAPADPYELPALSDSGDPAPAWDASAPADAEPAWGSLLPSDAELSPAGR